MGCAVFPFRLPCDTVVSCALASFIKEQSPRKRMFVFVGIVFFRMEKLSHFMRMDGNSEMMSGETV